jgi:hypothetical protein
MMKLLLADAPRPIRSLEKARVSAAPNLAGQASDERLEFQLALLDGGE